MTKRDEVEEFLRQLREKIRVFDVVFRPRDKNLNSLAEMDILPIDRILYLQKLTADNYYSGPNKDTCDPCKPDYFEFGMKIKGIEVYIKISLGLNNKRADCMSWHKAERPITYPLKEIRK